MFYAVEMLTKLMRTRDVALYNVVNQDYARIFSASSAKARSLGNSIRYREMTGVYEELAEEKVYINKNMDPRYPLMARAIYENGDIKTIKLDTNQNGTYDYNGDGWVSAKYLEVKEGTVGGNKTTTDSKGNTVTTDGTGTGVVANTYSGVNVRQGAGTGYAAVGKLLPGTTVQILELANGGKWGRTDKGWVCMDYITMVSYNPASSTTTADPSKGTAVDDLDKVDKTTTTAVYTGKIINTDGVTVFKEPINYDPSEVDAIAENTVRTLSNGAAVTIHELAEVTRTIKSDEDSFGGDKTYTTITSVTSVRASVWNIFLSSEGYMSIAALA